MVGSVEDVVVWVVEDNKRSTLERNTGFPTGNTIRRKLCWNVGSMVARDSVNTNKKFLKKEADIYSELYVATKVLFHYGKFLMVWLFVTGKRAEI